MINYAQNTRSVFPGGRWPSARGELASRTHGNQREGVGTLPGADRVAGPIGARVAAAGGGLFARWDL